MTDSTENDDPKGLVGGMGEDFLRRTHCYFEGELPPGEFESLQAEMLADAARREAFVRYSITRAVLLEKLQQRAQSPDLTGLKLGSSFASEPEATLNDAMIVPAIVEAEDTQAFEEERPSLSIPRAAATPSALPWRYARWAALVILPLLLALGIFSWRSGRPAPATLSAVANEQWGMPGKVPQVGDRLPSGLLSLKSGLAEVRLDNGVRMIVEGPTSFEIRSDRIVDLKIGKLTVAVPTNAHGFAVETPSSRVVDLGTRFGVVVDASGGSETHVIQGTVECTPVEGGKVVQLTADHAVRVDWGSATAAEIDCRTGDFTESLPAIDLVDIVAGGDGTRRQRNSGINLADGSVFLPPHAANLHLPDQEARIVSDGKFHPCPTLPLVAGVFIPRGGSIADTLDPAGDTFNFPATDGRSRSFLWAGGSVLGVPPEILQPTRIGSIDYNSPSHGTLELHPNKGVTFDLAGIRNAHPGRPFARFLAVCTNVAAHVHATNVSERSEFWVFVDGKLQFHKSPLLRTAAPFTVDVPTERTAHYLTLVATDGEDGFLWDWVMLGDPRLE